MKLDGIGNVEWEHDFGSSKYDNVRDIQLTADGGYIIAGRTEAHDDDYDAWIIRLDQSGSSLWSRNYANGKWGEAHSIQQTVDGGYIVGGIFSDTEGTNAWIAKLNAGGEIEWEKTYGESGTGAKSIQQTGDGGYVAAGYTQSGSTFWIIRLDSNGNSVWEKTDQSGLWSEAGFILNNPDGGYIVAGQVNTEDDQNILDQNILIMKLDPNGNTAWERTFGSKDAAEATNSLRQTSDGGFIISSCKKYYGADTEEGEDGSDAWVLKLSLNCELEWDKTFNGSLADCADDVIETTDGGYVMGGGTSISHFEGDEAEGDAWIIKFGDVCK